LAAGLAKAIKAIHSDTSMRFSKRTEWNIAESELALAHRERVASGQPIADLTASNPTRCGFTYPAELLEPLTDLRALDYDPDPKGSLEGRQAVCRYYADHGAEISPGQVLLTTSTSEAYGYLFKLLCDPGSEILVPQPSYPLFDFLARAESIEVAPTLLFYDYGWHTDLEGLKQRISEKTRAIVLVHPNNPTGHFTKLQEATELASICREFGLALIVDEVFLDYGVETTDSVRDNGSFASRALDVPVFVVSGISKICGLPQMKVAWVAALGPGAEEALARLEVLADTYLSMNAPVQRALPAWLGMRTKIQRQIQDRVRENLAILDSALAQSAEGRPGSGQPADRLQFEGGWYAVLRIPAIQPDELTAMELLELGVWLHPGYFFGMAESGWLVASLLTQTGEFSRGVSVLMEYLTRKLASSH
jgi:alanine-synthesizing transaminase